MPESPLSRTSVNGSPPLDAYRQSAKYKRRWWTLIVLSLSLVVIGMDNTILNVTLPTLQRELHASASTLQWIVDLYVLVFAGLLLTMGTVGDRIGRAHALRVGLVIFGAASAAAAYSGSSSSLIATRATMGVGAALIMPATLSIITDVFPREERGRAIGIWAGMAAMGIGIGPLVGGALLEKFWWGSVFLVNVPVIAIALVGGNLFVPNSRDPSPGAFDIPGVVLSIGAISSFVYAVIEAPSRGWADGLVLGGFALAIVLGAAFAWRELTTASPMLDFKFFRNPRFSFGAASIGVSFFCLFGTTFGMTQYMQFVHGYSPLGAGLRLAPVSLGMLMGSSNAHRWVTRFGTAKVVSVALLILAVVISTYSLWSPDTAYWVVLVTILFFAFGMSNIMTPSTEAVMGAVPLSKAGVGSAMNDVMRQTSGAFGIAVIGSLMNTIYSHKMANAVAALPNAAAGPAKDSIGGALQVAAKLPAAQGGTLANAARHSFTDAFGLALLAGAGTAIVMSALVLRFMPARHLGQQITPGTQTAGSVLEQPASVTAKR
ncbi:MAG: MFS transporter [Chloroflexi bacterium]|nr:MFS transporter [Chloroflexota bacterium]